MFRDYVLLILFFEIHNRFQLLCHYCPIFTCTGWGRQISGTTKSKSTKPSLWPPCISAININVTSRHKRYQSPTGFQEWNFCHPQTEIFLKTSLKWEHWTNQIACFDQSMKSDQSNCLFCSHFEHFGWHKPCCFMIPIFLSGDEWEVVIQVYTQFVTSWVPD